MFAFSRFQRLLHQALAERQPGLFPGLFSPTAAGMVPATPDLGGVTSTGTSATFMVLRGVTRRFGRLTALDGISLDINEGEVLGICGPNGAGKSTLLAAATGHLRMDAGEIALDGVRLTNSPPHRFCAAGIARLFQKPEIFASLSVNENVRIGAMFGSRAHLAGAPEVSEILERTELTAFAGRASADADLLTRKRIMLAAALATNPRILFLDEPLAGLNPAEIDAFLGLLVDVRRTFGLTLVIVEHKIRALAEISDRILVMNFGTQLKLGPPQEVLRDPEVVTIYLGKRHVA